MESTYTPLEDGATGPLSVRPFQTSDRARLQEIRHRAFQPIFEGFRRQLTDAIYALVYPDADAKQAELLDTMMESAAGGSEVKELHVLLLGTAIIGFVGLTVDEGGTTGELELNAIDPEHQGRGGGTFMYAFAVERMRTKGVQLLRVGTGADKNHAAARKAYEHAGFDGSLSYTVLYQLLSESFE